MLIKKNIFSEIKSKPHLQPAQDEENKSNSSEAAGIISEEPAIHRQNYVDTDELLEEARRQADEIIAHSRQQAEEILESAEERVQGEVQQIVSQKMHHLDELEQRAAEELESVARIKEHIFNESKPLIIEMAIELASKLINKRVREDSSILENMLQETVDQMLEGSEEAVKLTLIVNSEDERIAQSFADKLQGRTANRVEFSVRADDSVQRGSCIVESPSGSYDLNFSTQLELFKEKALKGDG